MNEDEVREVAAGPAVAPAELRADCDDCFGLCCVALPFAKTADFAIDKSFGEPCPNLQDDFRCVIHTQLRDKGFRGCTVYECFGAGQKTSRVAFGGVSWREAPETATLMFEVYSVERVLHELQWYLTEALTRVGSIVEGARRAGDQATGRTGDDEPRAELAAALAATNALTFGSPEDLMALDVEAHRRRTSELLLRASELIRTDALARQVGRRGKKPGRGPDFIGADLRKADFRGADLRGAYLIAANLTGADLRHADLIGADLRDADLGGADLTDSLFLTQTQLNAAKGDSRTKLPAALEHPRHWPR